MRERERERDFIDIFRLAGVFGLEVAEVTEGKKI
jgi:hypothetical protein